MYVSISCLYYELSSVLISFTSQGFPAYPRPADLSRPHTPANLPNRNSFSSEQNCFSTDMSGSGQNGHSVMPHPAMSPPYPATPSTASSTYSHNSFGFHPYPTHGRSSHSRSTSGSTHPRSTSPATSIMSAGTSMSSVSSGQLRAPVSAASTTSSLHISSKPKKRLYNKERKAICLYYQEHPNVRQEDIAAQWGVERSTVSKILKQKEKWLHLPEDEEDQIAKHRYVVSVFLRLNLIAYILISGPLNSPWSKKNSSPGFVRAARRTQ